MPTWEDLSEDAGAVLDAAGSTKTAILAIADAGPMALLFAAMHPERVSALALLSSYARLLVADDYPIGISEETVDFAVSMCSELWGTFDHVHLVLPERHRHPELVESLAYMFRVSLTPRAAAAQVAYLYRNMDARGALPLIKVPTLVLFPRDGIFFSEELSRYLVEHIEGARFVDLPGGEIGFIGEGVEKGVDEIAELLTGERANEVNRILTTVLFTDIADSTATAASLGDRRWRELLDAHDRVVREELRRFQGREINTVGDGFVAAFSGPPERFAALKRSSPRPMRSVSQSAPGSIQVNAKSGGMTLAVWRCTSRLGLERLRREGRCGSPGR